MEKTINLCLRATKMELWNGIRSAKFWLTIGGFVILMMLDTFPTLYAGSSIAEDGTRIFSTDIISMSLNVTNGASFLFWLRFYLYVIPYGCCFYEEYSKQAVKYRIGRCSYISYGIFRIVTCILLTGLSVWLTEMIYTLTMFF